MASVLELAEMANVVYDPYPNVSALGWETARAFRIGHFFACLFRKPATNEYVLSLCGTTPSQVGDVVSDVQLLLKFFPYQKDPTQEALLRSQAIAGRCNLTVTGHSLGG